MARYQNIVILTGAGLSAESGLGTFRGPGGLWENFRIEDVATPEAFARDPVRVHELLQSPPLLAQKGAAQRRPSRPCQARARAWQLC